MLWMQKITFKSNTTMDHFLVQCVIFLILTGTVSFANTDLINNMVHSLCGPQQQCHRNDSVDFSLEKVSCCLSCDCDEICKERNTCCKQHDPEDWYNVVKQTCKPAAKFPQASHIAVPEYLVRNTCPTGFSNLAVKHLCETDVPLHLEDVPFVSSQLGDIIYKNRHCASCHGEINTTCTTWNVVVDQYCNKEILWDLDFQPVNKSEIEKKLLGCMLTFERPEHVNWRKVICSQNPRRTCSAKMQDSELAADLEGLCNNSTDMRLFIGKYGKMYKNVYCYLCSQYKFDTACMQDPFRTDKSMLFLVDIDTVTKAERTKDSRCKPQEIYDEFFKKCRMLFCPRLSIANENSCQSLATVVYANYELQFKLEPEAPLRLTDDEIKLLASKIPALVKTAYKLQQCGTCLERTLTFLESRNSSAVKSFYLQMVIKSNDQCPQKRILEIAGNGELTEKYMTYRLNNRTVPFTTKYNSTSKTEDLITGTQIVSYSKRTSFLCPSYFSDRLFNCPKVSLSFKEMKFLAHITDTSTLNTAVKDNAVQVCVEDYFHYTGQSVSGSTDYVHSATLTIFFIIIIIQALLIV